jgi:hypothetical protein
VKCIYTEMTYILFYFTVIFNKHVFHNHGFSFYALEFESASTETTRAGPGGDEWSR